MKIPVTNPTVTSIGTSLGMLPRYSPNFDSTTGMLLAVANCLKGKGLPGGGVLPNFEPLAALLNAMPVKVREEIYKAGGLIEAIPQTSVRNIRAELLSNWATSQYPKRHYPAVAIGSGNGAATHLWAAMGIPWLPQTFLTPVRQYGGVHPDEPKQSFEYFQEAARTLLDANPDLQLHHMHDANQDRLMIQYMGYFRSKRLKLGKTYKQFLTQCLPRGSTIFVVECDQNWPTTTAPHVHERYIFQHGAVGGVYPDEFQEGSQRIEEYLERYDSHTRQWDAPEANSEQPEAEWGFEPALLEDIRHFAHARGYRVIRIKFFDPEDMSPLVCDLYRWWYRQRRMTRANRMVVEQFVMMDPYWCLHTGSCPFWLTFNKNPSAQTLENYINESEAWDEIYTAIFAHGVESVGLTPIERWQEIIGRARKKSAFLGVSPDKHPRDFGAFIRYHQDLKKIPARYPLPGPLDMQRLSQFLEEQGDKYKVRWIDDANGSPHSSGASWSASLTALSSGRPNTN